MAKEYKIICAQSGHDSPGDGFGEWRSSKESALRSHTSLYPGHTSRITYMERGGDSVGIGDLFGAAVGGAVNIGSGVATSIVRQTGLEGVGRVAGSAADTVARTIVNPPRGSSPPGVTTVSSEPAAPVADRTGYVPMTPATTTYKPEPPVDPNGWDGDQDGDGIPNRHDEDFLRQIEELNGNDDGGGPPQPPATPRPAAPVDNRTTEQKLTQLQDTEDKAIYQAAIGNPVPLRNYDKMMGVSRNPDEYTVGYYKEIKPVNGSFTLVKGDGPNTGHEAKAGNGAAVYIVNANGEKSHITGPVAQQMINEGTWAEPKVMHQGTVDRMKTNGALSSSQDIWAINGPSTYTIIKGDGPNTGHAAKAGNGAAVYAVNAKGERFHITGPVAQQMMKDGTWVEPRVMKQSGVDRLQSRGALASASDLMKVNESPTKPKPVVATSAPAPESTSESTTEAVEQPGDVIEPNSESAGEVAGDSDSSDSTEATESADEAGQEATESAGEGTGEGESTESEGEGQSETSEEDALAQGKGGGEGIGEEKKDEEAKSALATRRSKDEDRLKKIMKQREKWGGASASSGADALAAPVVTPSSNSQGFGGIPGQK